MAKEKIPVTAATRLLKQSKAAFTSHLYHYEERGGTTVSARELGVDEHQVQVAGHLPMLEPVVEQHDIGAP